MINFLNKFKREAQHLLQQRKIKKTLENIQSAVESVKGDFNLDSIYTKVGNELLKNNISSLFTIYDDKRDALNIKQYFTKKKI